MKRIAAPAALALAAALVPLAAACGSVAQPATRPVAHATPSASPPVQAGPPGVEVAASLGDADSGRVLQLRQGQVVSVALQEQNGFSQWSQPTSTDGAVLTPVPDPRAAAVRGATLASFRAVGQGQAQITSTATQECAPGTPCSALARAWFVTVTVA